jgi:hypothetical protein
MGTWTVPLRTLSLHRLTHPPEKFLGRSLHVTGRQLAWVALVVKENEATASSHWPQRNRMSARILQATHEAGKEKE